MNIFERYHNISMVTAVDSFPWPLSQPCKLPYHRYQPPFQSGPSHHNTPKNPDVMCPTSNYTKHLSINLLLHTPAANRPRASSVTLRAYEINAGELTCENSMFPKPEM